MTWINVQQFSSIKNQLSILPTPVKNHHFWGQIIYIYIYHKLYLSLRLYRFYLHVSFHREFPMPVLKSLNSWRFFSKPRHAKLAFELASLQDPKTFAKFVRRERGGTKTLQGPDGSRWDVPRFFGANSFFFFPRAF